LAKVGDAAVKVTEVLLATVRSLEIVIVGAEM
jgi:hypothetical protein